MSKKAGRTESGDLPIERDDDSIDIGRIMEAIKSIASREMSQEKAPPVPPSSSLGASSSGRQGKLGSEIEAPGPRSKIRLFFLRLMSPLAPLIKLLILPVYEEQRQILLSLHRTNQRLDALVARLDEQISRANRHQEYTKLLHHLAHNLVVEMSKLKIEEEMLKTKTRVMEKDFEILTQRERALEKKQSSLDPGQEKARKS
ncbi:MAG: hypothetical protein ACUVV5_12620 [Candidatus Aminicenantales bacterium]